MIAKKTHKTFAPMPLLETSDRKTTPTTSPAAGDSFDPMQLLFRPCNGGLHPVQQRAINGRGIVRGANEDGIRPGSELIASTSMTSWPLQVSILGQPNS